ncbi:MAG: hypothetical protein PHQ60_08310 [Sideroxydans sp.]|nr:hypothetical protein [Sideroxydans sp.]
MSSATSVVLIGLGLLVMYGIGVYALYRHDDEKKVSSAFASSGWWLAFTVSQFLCYLAITVH